MSWKHHIFLAALFVIFVYFIITGVMSMVLAGEVIHPPQAPVSPIDKNIAYPYASVSFKSRDETVQLHGWHFNANKTDKALIVVHGFGGNRFPFGEQTLDLIRAAADIKFNVLLFDLRNSGGAGTGISSFGVHEKSDVLGAIDYLRGAGYTNIAVLGVSTGANAAAIAAGESPLTDVGALILDSPVVDMRRFIMYHIRAKRPNLPEFPFDILAPAFTGVYINGDASSADAGVNLAKYEPRQVQLIYGTNDEIVSLGEITDLYNDYLRRAVGKISIWYVPGAAHQECFFYAKDEYLERVTLFLQRVFTME